MGLTLSTDFEVHVCSCGVTYALPIKFTDQLRKSHKTFFCPNGCKRWYSGDNEEEKLRKYNEQLKNQLAAREEVISQKNRKIEHLFRSKSAHKANYTRLKTKYYKVKKEN